MLVLIIGDTHIPMRSHDLPAKFKKLLVPGKIGQIICTGNITDRETLEYLKGVAPEVVGVRGEFDEPIFPLSLTIAHQNLRIGVIHGTQCVPAGDTDMLSAIARQMDVDVLISGGTHRFEAYEFENRFFINPGSATGAWTGLWSGDATPSFALMDIQGPVVVTYVYQLVEGEVKVDKVEYRKPDSSNSAPVSGVNSLSLGAATGAAGAGRPGVASGSTSPNPGRAW